MEKKLIQTEEQTPDGNENPVLAADHSAAANTVPGDDENKPREQKGDDDDEMKITSLSTSISGS